MVLVCGGRPALHNSAGKAHERFFIPGSENVFKAGHPKYDFRRGTKGASLIGNPGAGKFQSVKPERNLRCRGNSDFCLRRKRPNFCNARSKLRMNLVTISAV